MDALRKPEARPARKAKPTGEKFDAQAAFKQSKELYPKVTARLAE